MEGGERFIVGAWKGFGQLGGLFQMTCPGFHLQARGHVCEAYQPQVAQGPLELMGLHHGLMGVPGTKGRSQEGQTGGHVLLEEGNQFVHQRR